jgi:hypothetical protein
MNTRETYRNSVSETTPLFHRPFWLDAVAPGDWDAVVIEDEGRMKAYYLYAMRKNTISSRIYMPGLTQFLGPAYRVTAKNERDRLQQETEILEELCNRLPLAGEFTSRWQTGYFNWLPFHWKNYQQRVRYTYQLTDLANPDQLLSLFSDKIRREIKKGGNSFTISEVSDVTRFHELIEKNLTSKNVKAAVDPLLLQRVFQGCIHQHCGKIWAATDEDGHWAAAIFVAWDAETAYYIIGGKDNAYGNSGAMTLLFWNAFQYLKDKVKRFDFEGSMLKGVENYFRSFGSSQHMFFEITAARSILSKAGNSLREFRR